MHKFTIMARTMARRMGITRLLRSVIAVQKYEMRFSDALTSELREGDIVWDVGANVGFYTKTFLGIVGNSGSVVAFEPSPKSAARLLDLNEFKNLRVVQAALGNKTGKAVFRINEDETSPVNNVVDSSEPGPNTIEIAMYRAEDALQLLALSKPNVIKIDVEGYELECTEGLGRLLATKELRAVFVEIHFELLADRGLKFAPLSIEQVFKTAGFSVSWLDSSHLQAVRRQIVQL